MYNKILGEYVRLGYSFFNTGSKDKKVFTSWTIYQERKPTEKEISHWANSYTQNYAIVCGSISDIVVLDVDTKNGGDPTPFLNRGMREIRTPSGGYHFYIKYDPLLASTKHKKNQHNGILKAVDVQSNGSIVFAPPTKFSNGGYTVVNDAPVSECPDDLLVQIVSALEPEKKATDYVPFQGIANPGMGRPGDIFNSLMTWEDVLIPLGWKKVGQTSVVTYWRRPGKSDGISASTGWHEYDLFFPFTTSIPELEPMKGYTKFRLYAVLNHGGDFAKAAKALVVENYKHVMKRI